VLKRVRVFLISDLEDGFVSKMGFVPFRTINDALGAADAELGRNSSVIIMPHGGSTLPVCAE